MSTLRSVPTAQDEFYEELAGRKKLSLLLARPAMHLDFDGIEEPIDRPCPPGAMPVLYYPTPFSPVRAYLLPEQEKDKLC